MSIDLGRLNRFYWVSLRVSAHSHFPNTASEYSLSPIPGIGLIESRRFENTGSVMVLHHSHTSLRFLQPDLLLQHDGSFQKSRAKDVWLLGTDLEPTTATLSCVHPDTRPQALSLAVGANTTHDRHGKRRLT